jgi:alkylation response protein AidB-like acyl-CoA dehydrogenase
MPSFTSDQVAQHNSESDCWIIIHDKVYDVTSFLADHPGGKKVILKQAGTDATKQFEAFHDVASTLTKYGPSLCIGDVVSTQPAAPAPVVSDAPRPYGDLVPFGDPSWYQDTIDSPYYKESHKLLRAAVRAFTEREIMPYVHEWDEAKQIPRSLFGKLAEQGILHVVGTGHEPEYIKGIKILGVLDGEDYDVFHGLVIMDELSRCASGGMVWGLFGGHAIGLPPVVLFGSEELKARIVPQCVSGEKNICLAITEPYAGSDVANLKCEAKLTPDGQHYIVNGEKKWITNGVFADYFTVAVRTGGEGMSGISMLLVERTMPGVTTRQMKCSGVWSSGTTYITFEDVKVPKANLIGDENKGFRYIMYNFNPERLGLAIQANRFARECLSESIKYAHKRRTFGVRLIDHQVIRHKIAQMAYRVESTHAWIEQLLYRTTQMSHQEAMIKLGGPIALLKVQSTQTFEYCAREAAQIFGGLAYTRGGQGEKVERLYREVRAYAIPGGSEEIMTELGIRQAIKVAEFMGAKL